MCVCVCVCVCVCLPVLPFHNGWSILTAKFVIGSPTVLQQRELFGIARYASKKNVGVRQEGNVGVRQEGNEGRRKQGKDGDGGGENSRVGLIMTVVMVAVVY